MRANCLIFLLIFPFAVFGHSGGVDANGCHVDSSTGTAHCHNASGDDSSTERSNESAMYSLGIRNGRSQCINNPASCGIEETKNDDGSTREGIQRCQNNPADCGITVDFNHDGSTVAGMRACQDDPAVCGIKVNQNNDGSTEEGMQICRDNPADCGIENTGVVESVFYADEGRLHIPSLHLDDVPENRFSTDLMLDVDDGGILFRLRDIVGLDADE